MLFVFSSHEPKALGELIGWDSKRRLSTLSESSWLIKIKFYLEHHLGVGKAALGFEPNQIRTSVSMATDSTHRVIKGILN